MNKKNEKDVLFIITRPDESGAALTARYLADGCQALHLPVMEYKTIADKPENAMAQKMISMVGMGAIAFTSANGVRAFVGVGDKDDMLREKNIFAVGPMTAVAVTTMLASNNVITAGGDVEKLAQTIVAEYKKKPWQGQVIHIGAVATAGEGRGMDLVTRLQHSNIPAEKIALYDMVAVDKIADDILQKITTHEGQKNILFFSPRTVVLTAELLKKHGLAPADFFATCHSAAVAAVARSFGFRGAIDGV